MASTSQPVLIAGGGVAGLTAALALAAEGFRVELFESTQAFAEVGAGLQLSPNATHILRRLGVLEHLLPYAVQPQAVVLHDAATLRPLTEIPLGPQNANRWGAPYLVAHRAAVQRALLQTIQPNPQITIRTGVQGVDVAFDRQRLSLSLVGDNGARTVEGAVLVAADGVWSSLRRFTNGGQPAESAFSGMTAWRTTLSRAEVEALGLTRVMSFDRVSTFLDPQAHLVAYPIEAGQALNLVAITRGTSGGHSWVQTDGRGALNAFLATLPQPLRALGSLSNWTRWPLYGAPPRLRWTSDRIALIGDAAHAMLPFAAQGAATAIEDAAVLATRLGEHRDDPARALAAYEAERRPRIERVLARGRLNRLAWHAAGPVALGRNVVFKLKGPQSLAADLDWLYGWKEPRVTG